METNRDAHVARLAAAIGQPARAAMLDALLGGEWLTAGELARRSGGAPATASQHLATLVDAGLVRLRRSGRHRYHALAGVDVAAALEALGRIPAPREPAGGSRQTDALRFARTCYDHLAGTLGVRITEGMVERGLLAPTGAETTDRGVAWLADLGIDAEALRGARRSYVRFCLDWTERRDHVAGAVGAALLSNLLARGWIARIDGTRAVRLTLRGRESLRRALGVDVGA